MKIHNIKKYILATVLFLVVLSFVSSPRHASAQFVPVTAPATDALLSTIAGNTTGLVATETTELELFNLKEFILDVIVFAIGDVLLEQITESVVNWINSGFDGNPAFIQDLGGFLENTADLALDEYLSGTEYKNLICSPFQIDIDIALRQTRRPTTQPQCTIDKIVNNVESFIDGNFSEGGWRGWFDLTTKPQNNPYSAYILASDRASRAVLEKVGVEQKKLDFGRGFRSFEVCSQPADGVGPPHCVIGTPGVVIEQQLQGVLQIGQNRLTIADEVDEIVGALLSQILTEILTGSSDGLAGYTPSGGGGLGSFDLTCNADLGPGSRVVERSLLTDGPHIVPGIGELPKNVRFNVPLDGHYPEAEIDIDFFISEAQPDPYKKGMPVVSVGNQGKPSDLKIPSPAFHMSTHMDENELHVSYQQAPWASGLNRIVKVPAVWQENTWYHAQITYNAYANVTTGIVTVGKGRGGAEVARASAPAHASLFPQLGGMKVAISGENLAENGAHMEGAQYENIEVTFTPGEPVCRPVNGRPVTGADPIQ